MIVYNEIEERGHTQWTQDLLGQKMSESNLQFKDFKKDSGFEDVDYFYLDTDYLLLPNDVTRQENNTDERLHFTLKNILDMLTIISGPNEVF